jgi:hypothetical protein
MSGQSPPEDSIELIVMEDLEFLQRLGLVRQLPDGEWCKTQFAIEIGPDGWSSVVAAALAAQDNQGS